MESTHGDMPGGHLDLLTNHLDTMKQKGESTRRTKDLPWQRDLLEESLRAVGLPGIENGAQLFVSNLDSGVSNEDIRELFSEIGELRRYAIHYKMAAQVVPPKWYFLVEVMHFKL